MSIFFPGDRVRATWCGHVLTGTIEGFGYNVQAIAKGDSGDVARIRLTEATAQFQEGDLITVPVADLTAAGS